MRFSGGTVLAVEQRLAAITKILLAEDNPIRSVADEVLSAASAITAKCSSGLHSAVVTKVMRSVVAVS